MTSSTNSMNRYTTTEYGKQNMFAHEPQIQVDYDHDYWKNDSNKVEDWNSMFSYDPYFGTLPPGFENK